MADDALIELARLQIQLQSLIESSRRAPWYRQIPSLVAALAFLVSLATTGLAFYSTYQQQRRLAYADLQDVILKLARLPRERMEANLRFANRPGDIASIGSYYATESNILVRRASTLAWIIPDLVTPAEHRSIASNMVSIRMFEPARKHFEAAIASGLTKDDMVAAHRGMANLEFQSGNLERGRKHYALARSVLRSNPDPNLTEDVVNWLDFSTEIFWARNEGVRGSCDAWSEHLKFARDLITRVHPTRVETLKTELTQAERAGCHASSQPVTLPALASE